MRKSFLPRIAWPTAVGAALSVSAALVMSGVTTAADAASSDACEGGGFSLVNKSTGAVVAAGEVDAAIGAARFGTGAFAVRGRYVTFDVRPRDFAVLNFAFTGAANEEDITGGDVRRCSPARCPTTAASP